MVTSLDSPARRWIRRVSLVLAAVFGTLYAVLSFTGGFTTSLLGLHVSSHDPHKSLLATALLLTLYVLAGGHLWPQSVHHRHLIRRMVLWPGRLDQRLIVGALALAVVVTGLTYGSFTAGGSDSYGYVSEANLWLRGQLVVPQPWALQVPWPDAIESFSPLAYRPRGRDAIVPTYPAGLPLLMAFAQITGGPCAVFWVTPVSGGVLVFFTWLLAGRLGSRRAGLIAAWLVATSPPVVLLLLSPLTDLPVAAAWTVAWYLLLGPGMGSALGAGLVGGLASLIRPNLAPFCAVFLLWKLYQWYRAPAGERPAAFGRLVALGIGFLPGAIALLLMNDHLYGSPLLTGYGPASNYFSTANVLPNVRNYWSWFLEAQTPVAVIGLVALVLPIKRLWSHVPDRGVVVIAAIFVIGIWAQYLAFAVFDTSSYIRFLLSCWPLIMIGLARVFELAIRPSRPLTGVAVVVCVLLLGWRGLRAVQKDDVFTVGAGEHKFLTAALLARDYTPENSVLLSMLHSGSIRHYGGRITLRYEFMQPSRIDQDMAWLASHGAHPYALIEPWEADLIRKRFAGTVTAARLDQPPVFMYHGPSRVLLFDLLPGSPAQTREFVEDPYPVHCLPPAPLPQLVMK